MCDPNLLAGPHRIRVWRTPRFCRDVRRQIVFGDRFEQTLFVAEKAIDRRRLHPGGHGHGTSRHHCHLAAIASDLTGREIKRVTVSDEEWRRHRGSGHARADGGHAAWLL